MAPLFYGRNSWFADTATFLTMMTIRFALLTFLGISPLLAASEEQCVMKNQFQKQLSIPTIFSMNRAAYPGISSALKDAVHGQPIMPQRDSIPAVLEKDERHEPLFSRAFRDRSIRLEELSLPDGRRMTKVHSGSTTYCVYKESLGLTKGRDQLAGGVRTMATSCP
jgi:hypothetical protein